MISAPYLSRSSSKPTIARAKVQMRASCQICRRLAASEFRARDYCAPHITVVDTDAGRLHKLQDRLDLRTATGNAGHPEILERPGARDANLILAVTQNDETNLVACKLAATMFNIPLKIARIRAASYLSHPEMFSPENFAVDQ
jgi:hypothetical protein